MSKKNKKEKFDTTKYNANAIVIEEHGSPDKMSRRELLAQGFINGTGMVAAPSVISTLVSQRAFACGEQESAVDSTIPVLILDLAGGGNLVGPNIVPGREGGQDDVIGGLAILGIKGNINAVSQFGLKWHNESMILRGMQNAIPEEARDKVKGIVFASKSLDDNDTNQVNPAHALVKAGLNGKLVPFAAGNGRTEGTAKSKLPNSSMVAGLSPVTITKSDDARSLVKKHELAQNLTPEALDKIIKAAAGMSESALCEFNKKSLSEQLKAVCGCKHDKSLKIMTEFSEQNITPALDPQIQAIYNGNFGADSAQASYAKLLVNNYAGVGVLQRGGFDYHNGTRSLGDAKDLILGDEIGRIIAYAHAINKPVSVVILTDGGVTSNQADEGGYTGALASSLGANGRADLAPLVANEQLGQKMAWRSDAQGVRGAAVMFTYHPNGVKQVRNPQVGAFEDGGVVKQVNELSGNGRNLVAAITANWLALQGKQGDISKVMNNDIAGSLDEYVVFGKIG